MSKEKQPLDKPQNGNDFIADVSKRDLGNHLAEVIKECSDGMAKLKIGSVDWTWLASKKTLAESILIKFC